jgi:hypothetical protein
VRHGNAADVNVDQKLETVVVQSRGHFRVATPNLSMEGVGEGMCGYGVGGGVGGQVGGGEDKGVVRVVFININDMYNNDVGKGGVRVYEACEVK